MRVLRFGLPVLLALFVLAPVRTEAAIITVSLPDYDGPSNGSGFPVDLGVVGTFNYVVPAGSVIASATFSGTVRHRARARKHRRIRRPHRGRPYHGLRA